MSEKNAIVSSAPRGKYPVSTRNDYTYFDLTQLDKTSLRRDVSRPRHKGWFIIIGFCLILFGWGGTAPISGGAMAPGSIMPENGRKKVQHYEGGIIRTILVSEGEEVALNQPLINLADVSARSKYDELGAKSHSLQARLARLKAEQANSKDLVFPTDIGPASPELASILDAQKRIFETRKKMYVFKRKINKERHAQLQKSITGIEARLNSTRFQLRLNQKTLRIKRRLYRKKLIKQDQVVALKNRESELRGSIGQFEADISKTRQRISELGVELSVTESQRLSETSLELETTRSELASVTQRLKASADILVRSVIRAPVAGTIVDLKPTTAGGVIIRGETLMTIAQPNEKVFINARISPRDIDIVHAGLTAKVQISAYRMRELPPIDATVRSISPDSLVAENGQEPYYLARVEINSDKLAQMAPNIKLVPGMPASVLIVTKARTMLDYLVEPILAAMRKSMREA